MKASPNSIRARKTSSCPICGQRIRQGMLISKTRASVVVVPASRHEYEQRAEREVWAHTACADSMNSALAEVAQATPAPEPDDDASYVAPEECYTNPCDSTIDHEVIAPEHVAANAAWEQSQHAQDVTVPQTPERALISKWRSEATGMMQNSPVRATLLGCAKQLERALDGPES